MESAELVERGTILRATVGSTVHGLHHGGHDDRDEMAVFVQARSCARIDAVETKLADALERTALPPEPDRERVDEFLVDAYRRAWGW